MRLHKPINEASIIQNSPGCSDPGVKEPDSPFNHLFTAPGIYSLEQ